MEVVEVSTDNLRYTIPKNIAAVKSLQIYKQNNNDEAGQVWFRLKIQDLFDDSHLNETIQLKDDILDNQYQIFNECDDESQKQLQSKIQKSKNERKGYRSEFIFEFNNAQGLMS